MRDDLLNETPFFTIGQAYSILARWVDDYNNERPHSSLGYATPAAFAAGLEQQRAGLPPPQGRGAGDARQARECPRHPMRLHRLRTAVAGGGRTVPGIAGGPDPLVLPTGVVAPTALTLLQARRIASRPGAACFETLAQAEGWLRAEVADMATGTPSSVSIAC